MHRGTLFAHVIPFQTVGSSECEAIKPQSLEGGAVVGAPNGVCMTVKTENTQSVFPSLSETPSPSKSTIEDAHLKPKTHISHCFLNEPSSPLFKSNLTRTTTRPRKKTNR